MSRNLGCSLWLLLGAAVLLNRSPELAAVWLGAFLVLQAAGTVLWMRRDRLRAYAGFQIFLSLFGRCALAALVSADMAGHLSALGERTEWLLVGVRESLRRSHAYADFLSSERSHKDVRRDRLTEQVDPFLFRRYVVLDLPEVDHHAGIPQIAVFERHAFGAVVRPDGSERQEIFRSRSLVCRQIDEVCELLKALDALLVNVIVGYNEPVAPP